MYRYTRQDGYINKLVGRNSLQLLILIFGLWCENSLVIADTLDHSTLFFTAEQRQLKDSTELGAAANLNDLKEELKKSQDSPTFNKPIPFLDHVANQYRIEFNGYIYQRGKGVVLVNGLPCRNMLDWAHGSGSEITEISCSGVSSKINRLEFNKLTYQLILISHGKTAMVMNPGDRL